MALETQPKRPIGWRIAKRSEERPMLADMAAYTPICDAIALLFRPYAEVVLHELSSQSVVHIAGNFSKRVLGEPSLLDEIGFDPDERIIGPYEKVNWDGRRIKSVSVVLSAGEGPIGVLCINVDVSHFHGVLDALNALVSIPVQTPKHPLLFKEDWHERINEFVQHWTRSRGLLVTSLTRDQKRELVADLAKQGAFGGRNAAAYISRILGMARATVYNYLSQAAVAAETVPVRDRE